MANRIHDIKGLPNDLLTSEIYNSRRLKTSSLDSFSSAGASGLAFARTIPITLSAGGSYSIKLQKNSNIAVEFIRAKGLFISAITGTVSGGIVELDDLISTNGVLIPAFSGSIEVYDGEATGQLVLGSYDSLAESFYPDGQFVIGLKNTTTEIISTFLSIGVEQISDAGAYITLQPDTQIESTTEMSIYNGLN